MIIDLSHAKSSIRYCCKSKIDIYVYLSDLGLMVGSRALITGTQQTQGGKPVDHPATVLSPRFIAVASPQAPPAGSLAQGVWLPADSRLTPVVVVDQGMVCPYTIHVGSSFANLSSIFTKVRTLS